MANTREHVVPKAIQKLIGVKNTDFAIVSIAGTGTTKDYPALDDNGNKLCALETPPEEYLAAKVERERLAVRLDVEGNAVTAEWYINSVTGYECCAISSTCVDVYVPMMVKS